MVVAFTTVQSQAVKAQTKADSNAQNISDLLTVIKVQNDRQMATEKQQGIHAYQLESADKIHERQNEQLEHLTKITERIAAKLQVSTK